MIGRYIIFFSTLISSSAFGADHLLSLRFHFNGGEAYLRSSKLHPGLLVRYPNGLSELLLFNNIQHSLSSGVLRIHMPGAANSLKPVLTLETAGGAIRYWYCSKAYAVNNFQGINLQAMVFNIAVSADSIDQIFHWKQAALSCQYTFVQAG